MSKVPTLSYQVTRTIVFTCIAICASFLAIGIPLELRGREAQLKTVDALLESITVRESNQLANELFELRAEASQLRLDMILDDVPGLLRLVLFNHQRVPVAHVASTSIDPAGNPDSILPVEPLDAIHQQVLTRKEMNWGWIYGQSRLVFERTILVAGQALGSLQIVYDLGPMRSQTISYYMVFTGFFVLTLGSLFVILRRTLQRSFIRPLHALRDAMVEARPEVEAIYPKYGVPSQEINDIVRAYEDMSSRLAKAFKVIEESEQRFRSIFDNAPYAIVINSFEDGRFLDVNEAYLNSKGLTKEQAMALSPKEASGFPLDQQAVIRDKIRQGGLFNIEAESERPDGSIAYVLHSSVPIPYGEEEAILSMVVDITDKKRAELALAQSEKKYREIFNNAPIGIFRTAYAGYFIEANPSLARMFGYESPDQMLAQVKDLSRDIYPSQEERGGFLDALRKNPAGITMEIEFKRKDGTPLYAITHASLQMDESGKPSYLDGTIEDITERKRAEEALKASERKFSELFMLSPDSIVLSRADTDVILEVNESFVTTFGYERQEVIGKIADEFGLYANGKQRDEMLRQLKSAHGMENLEIQLAKKNGDGVIFSVSGRTLIVAGEPVYLVIGRDITEQKKMQQMMVQTEKMLSVGGIAAGIAHEINNPLGIILQTAQNLAQRTRPDFRKNIEVAEGIGLDMGLLETYMQTRGIHTFVDNIQTAALRAAAIIRHMLDFSRRSESKRTVCDLSAIIDKAITLAASDYNLKKNYDFKRINIVRDFVESLPPFNCTETEIEQVILNLLRNAAQAMAESDPPTVEPEIRLSITHDNQHIRMEITDNGPGLTPEVKNRIFEPFFTTKPTGQGTGLGLSVSYFIITKGHGGTMDVESSPGKGTTFIIELPIDMARTSEEA